MSAAAVSFLLVEQEPGSAGRVQQALQDATLANATELVDVPAALRAMRSIRARSDRLESSIVLVGFNVEQASDGVEGLALAQQCLPDIVLLDCHCRAARASKCCAR